MKQVLKTLLPYLINNKFVFNLSGKLSSYINQLTYKSLSKESIRDLIFLMQPHHAAREDLLRIGNENDGGYVIYSKVSPANTFLISLGVGSDITFDLSMNDKVQHSILVDHTVKSLPSPLNNATFINKKISPFAGIKSLTLFDCINMVPRDADIVLKIDIEGSEWDVLDQIDTKNLNRFTQIIGEFHDFHEIYSRSHYAKVMRVLTKLNKTHVNINFHPNNWSSYRVVYGLTIPDVIEFTFLRNDIYKLSEVSPPSRTNCSFDQSLNSPNNPQLFDYPTCLFSSTFLRV